MPRTTAGDELEPPERRRDFVAEPPEAEHPVYPRQSGAKTSPRRTKTTETTPK